MNSWETHQVEFAPAEGLEANQTSVRMLDNEVDEDERVDNISARIDELGDDDIPVHERLYLESQLTNEIRKDAGYKFLMMVA